MTVQTQGVMDVIAHHGRRYLRCPGAIIGCGFRAELTDMGELVDTGVTEGQLRAHLASHDVLFWVSLVRAHRKERERWQDTASHAGLCSWCECPRGQCVQLWEDQRKCCPDCEHGAEPQDPVVSECCAVQALTEVATALAEQTDPSAPADREWLASKAKEHLATVQGDHAKSGDHEGSWDGHQ